MKSTEIKIDGSRGEGGGQILRSALSLSAITGKGFSLEKIRAGRKRPGLMRQHLTCVESAAKICGAEVSDIRVGSGRLDFVPGKIETSHDTFAIGTAGSTMLLLQTVLPILLSANGESEVILRGGTHALNAPSFHYIDEIFIPLLQKMGAKVSLELEQFGFFPAGGGAIKLTVEGSKLERISVAGKVEPVRVSAEVINTPDIPESVAIKEIAGVEKGLALVDSRETRIEKTLSPGNVLILRSVGEPGTLVSVCGDKNKRSEQVAKQAVREMQRYINSPAAVDEYLADQLLLPMALAGGGEFTAAALTPHFHSNVEVIESFLPIRITPEQIDRFAWNIKINSND